MIKEKGEMKHIPDFWDSQTACMGLVIIFCEDPIWGQPTIYFPIGDHVNVSRCRSHTNASGIIATSYIVASHITKLLLRFRHILKFRF